MIFAPGCLSFAVDDGRASPSAKISTGGARYSIFSPHRTDFFFVFGAVSTAVLSMMLLSLFVVIVVDVLAALVTDAAAGVVDDADSDRWLVLFMKILLDRRCRCNNIL